MDDSLPLHPWVGLQLQCNFWHFILHTMNGTFLPHDRASDILGVSWCCRNYCLFVFVLWCGYCSVSFQSFVLRHWCPQHQETADISHGHGAMKFR